MITVAAVLAAGNSSRFGDEDKLLAILKGRPLAAYAAAAVEETNVDRRVVAFRNSTVKSLFKSFDQIEIIGDQSESLKACVQEAQKHDADRLLVTLADMPMVGPDLLSRLLTRDPGLVSAAYDGVRVTVPAVFPNARFADLLQIQGDMGARVILAEPDTVRVSASNEELVDVDTKMALKTLNLD